MILRITLPRLALFVAGAIAGALGATSFIFGMVTLPISY
jgi:hypothetical protein